jgi:hypothetical protein
MGYGDKRPLSRRSLFKGIAAVGLAAVVTKVVPVESSARAATRRGVTVFRLRTRDTRSCNACKLHHRYMVFISRAHADRHRAHPGCNCPIVRQKISQERFRQLFLDTRAIRDGVVDLRAHRRRA